MWASFLQSADHGTPVGDVEVIGVTPGADGEGSQIAIVVQVPQSDVGDANDTLQDGSLPTRLDDALGRFTRIPPRPRELYSASYPHELVQPGSRQARHQ